MNDKNLYADGFKVETQKQINAAFLSLLIERDQLTQQRDQLTQQRDQLTSSTIWRVTKPIRKFIDFLKKLKKVIG